MRYMRLMHRPSVAALALCAYKPTLLLLILPMLLLTRRTRTLAGMALGGAGLGELPALLCEVWRRSPAWTPPGR